MTASGRKIALTEHIEIEWLQHRIVPALCPNCGAQGGMEQILDIVFNPPDPHEDEHRFTVQTCPACSVRFVDNTMMMDYSTERLIQLGWDSYQVQLGAGIWPITAQLARLDKPAGAKVLEIGGAFGFGLDFCIRACGWNGVGYDPSPLAAFGTQELGLPLRQEYFAVKHLGLGPWDVAVATELIEHISYPVAFLLIMRRALGETGVLILSTPDAAFITPDTPVATLLPLLSPGAHTVLQTAQSLEVALRAAGFVHTHILHDGTSLVAYASASPFALLEDEAARRATYRNYLVERARISPEISDLRLGFAGRGIFESANDGDWAAADAAWAALLPAVQARFGLDLESMTALPAGAHGASLHELCALMPLGLGMILFGRAMRRLEAGDSRVLLEPMLRLAADGVEALLSALAKRSLMDGLSASLAVLLRTELLICAAAAGRIEAVAGLTALGDEVTSWRGFIELVNAGEIGHAAVLKETLPEMPAQNIPAGLRRDAVLSLVNFYLAPESEPLRALPCAEALQAHGEDMDEALLGVFTRLVNAGQHDEAQAVARQYDIQALTRHHASAPSGRDAAMAQAMLALALGDPADIPALLTDLPLSQAQKEAVLLEAFVRLVNAGRHDAATTFSAAHDLPALLARADDHTGRDARLACITLQLAAGDPAAVPALLEGVALEPVQRETVLLQAFTRLANAARYAEARGFAAAHDVLALLRRQTGKTAADAAIGFAVLELADGDPATVPALLAGQEIAPARSEALLLQAFTRLANAARYAEARGFAQTHDVLDMLRRHEGASAADAAIGLAVLELADGDPSLVPALLAGHNIPLEQRTSLVLGAFTGLVNAGRHEEAEALAASEPSLQQLDSLEGPAAEDARWAELMLDLQRGRAFAAARTAAAREAAGGDAARLAAVYADAFIRLVNAGDFAAARNLHEEGGLERRIALSPPAVRHDALASMLVLDAQAAFGDAQSVPARLRVLYAAGMEEARVTELGFQAFSLLVNQAAFAPARELLPQLDPALVKLKPPFTALARDALFAAGILYLQEQNDWRRGAATFARLRDGLVKQTPRGQTPDPLFWPALRGEVVTLNQLNRGGEAVTLMQSFLDAYPGAPEDLREQLKGAKA